MQSLAKHELLARSNCSQGDYTALQRSVEPFTGTQELKTAPGWLFRVITRLVAALLLVASLVLAAVSLERYIRSNKLYIEVRSECYGRYEMCLETSWKGNADMRPYPGDDYFIPMNILDKNQLLEEAVVGEAWGFLCEQNAYETSNDSLSTKTNAPWFCKCLEELQFRCYRINKDPMLKVDDILGFWTRAGILIEALKLSDESKKAILAGQALVAVGMVLIIVTLIPWKHLRSRFATRWTEGADATLL